LKVDSDLRHHARHSSIASSRSACEAAGLKLSQVEVASRRHISARKRVRRLSLDRSFINPGIESLIIRSRIAAYSSRCILFVLASADIDRNYAEYFRRREKLLVRVS